MSRDTAIEYAAEHFDSGAIKADLFRRVAYRTESQNPDHRRVLYDYLTEEIIPFVQRLGFTARIVENPAGGSPPFLIAHRTEDPVLPTVLTYGHGDVQPAHGNQWREGLAPWEMVVEGDRWYGRGTADNKSQHSINLSALEQVIRVRNGSLGYNVTLLMDMGEESGSPGLTELCEQAHDELAADLLIASDGPRLSAGQPTVFLGARGSVNFTLSLQAREKSHHSGNWGGLLRNPATVLANALASLVDGNGRLLPESLRPPPIPEPVRRALANITIDESPESPAIDSMWGEPGLTPSERLFGWNTLEVLAMTSGNPDSPVNAIPASARIHCQLRFVVGRTSTMLGSFCGNISIRTAFPPSTSRSTMPWPPPDWTRMTRGCGGRWRHWNAPPANRRRCCPILEDRCQTTPSPAFSDSRQFGYRIRTRAARSTPPTSMHFRP